MLMSSMWFFTQREDPVCEKEWQGLFIHIPPLSLTFKESYKINLPQKHKSIVFLVFKIRNISKHLQWNINKYFLFSLVAHSFNKYDTESRFNLPFSVCLSVCLSFCCYLMCNEVWEETLFSLFLRMLYIYTIRYDSIYRHFPPQPFSNSRREILFWGKKEKGSSKKTIEVVASIDIMMSFLVCELTTFEIN